MKYATLSAAIQRSARWDARALRRAASLETVLGFVTMGMAAIMYVGGRMADWYYTVAATAILVALGIACFGSADHSRLRACVAEMHTAGIISADRSENFRAEARSELSE